MTYDAFLASIQPEGSPPARLSPELEALWHTKAGNWDAAHEITQDIPSRHGSWIHALLHTIEGDMGNAAYWYHRAGRDPIRKTEIEKEWTRLVQAILEEEKS